MEQTRRQRGIRKRFIGVVVSNKMDKTVVVRVERLVQHPRYQKTVRRFSRFKAHDPDNRCQMGDWVSLMESRPLSHDKRWRVREILKRQRVEAVPEEGKDDSAADHA